MDIANHLLSPSPPPSTPPLAVQRRASHSTRDQRLQIQTLYTAGLTYSQIQGQLGDVTLHQIAYAIQHLITLKKRSRRLLTLTPEEIEEIITWVCLSKSNRRLP
jgi:uncharacterized protein YgbK (DUF1537 family)